MGGIVFLNRVQISVNNNMHLRYYFIIMGYLLVCSEQENSQFDFLFERIIVTDRELEAKGKSRKFS